MELRPDQQEMIEQARAHMRNGRRRILLQAPTGFGKTILSAFMIRNAAERGHRCWFNMHRKELIGQTSKKFTQAGIHHGFIAAKMPFNPFERVLLTGIGTLAGRLSRVQPPYLMVWDECHHITAATWRRVFDAFPDVYHIGLSATPERLDGRGLDEFFDVLVQGPSTSALIEAGHLAPFRYFAPSRPDMAGVPTLAGDWEQGTLASIMDTPKLVGDVVEHYQRLAPGERGVVFAVNREHSRNLAAAFVAAGVRAAHIDGDSKDRDELVAAYRAGGVDMLCNVDLFGEGFDVPEMVYCGLARPTKSLRLFRQQVGRSLRTCEGKAEAVIADHAGNAFVHGLPDDHYEWKLEGRKARLKADKLRSDATPIHQCPLCYQVTYSNRVTCPCGHVFAAKDRMPGWEEGQLMPLERGESERVLAKLAAADARKAEERDCKTIGQLIALAKKRGYPKPAGWASLTLRKRSKSFWARGGFQQRRAG